MSLDLCVQYMERRNKTTLPKAQGDIGSKFWKMARNSRIEERHPIYTQNPTRYQFPKNQIIRPQRFQTSSTAIALSCGVVGERQPKLRPSEGVYFLRSGGFGVGLIMNARGSLDWDDGVWSLELAMGVGKR